MDPILGTFLILGLVVVGSIYLISHKKPNVSPWKKLADQSPGLHFQPANPPYTEGSITGSYQKCQIELHTAANKTFLTVTSRSPVGETPVPAIKKPAGKVLSPAEVKDRLIQLIPHEIRGVYLLEPDGQSFHYEQQGLEEDISYLKALFNTFSSLAALYPEILVLGGEAVPFLADIARSNWHTLQPVALCWLHQIAQETETRLGFQAGNLVCPSCLARCAAHEETLAQWQQITYYGCGACRQSQEFINVTEAFIVVIDQRMTRQRRLKQGHLWVNWLAHPILYDFDRVEIGQASDEEVERFAVQAGNGAGEAQRVRFKDIPCQISSAANLSENTLRILRRMFGQVEIKDET